MKRILAFGFIAGLSMAGMSGAQAATSASAPAADSGLAVAISGGCGPYGHRGYSGYCRPNRMPAPVYYRRGCPWRTHPTPWGCRPNY